MDMAVGDGMDILVVEPEADRGAELADKLVRWGFVPSRSVNHLGALSLFDEHRFDMVLASASATDIDGLELSRLIRHREKGAEFNFAYILLYGQERSRALIGEEKYRSLITESGSAADDFLIHPFLDSELQWRLGKGAKLLRRMYNLQRSLLIDPQSSLLNISGLHVNLQNEINRAARKQSELCVVLLRLDNLELSTQDYGPEWQDWLETFYIANLKDKLRNYDLLGQLDRSAYCLIAPETDRAGAQGLIKRLHAEHDRFRKLHDFQASPSELRLCVEGIVLELDIPHTKSKAAVQQVWDWLDKRLQEPLPSSSLIRGRLNERGLEVEA